MKKTFLSVLLFLFLILILLFPAQTLEGSREGLLLWFERILPTLLPFTILTGFLIRIDGVHYLTFFFAPAFQKLFHISHYGCYAMITGFLCGYPMGAKTTAELVLKNRISLKEGQYLLGICNNVSPVFYISYVITQTLHMQQQQFFLLVILYLSPLIYAFITRPTLTNIDTRQQFSNQETTSFFEILDSCIMNGFETITKLGGYIILFSIIAKMETALLNTVTILHLLIIGLIEITNGIHAIALASVPVFLKVILASSLTAFGGLSGVAQTKSMIQETPLSIFLYIKTKLIITCITLILSLLFCLFIL